MTDMNQPAPPPPPAPPAKPKRVKPKSRPQRWADAASNAATALSNIEAELASFSEAMSELRSVQEEYEQWKDNLPDNLQSSALAEKLDEIVGLEIESKADEIEQVISDARDVVD